MSTIFACCDVGVGGSERQGSEQGKAKRMWSKDGISEVNVKRD